MGQKITKRKLTLAPTPALQRQDNFHLDHLSAPHKVNTVG
jgi:hypothetical protein